MQRWIIYILPLFIAVLSACNHDLDDELFTGPELVAVPEGFQVVGGQFDADPNPVDFSVEADTFKAVFSDRVSWLIEIEGLQSGATKKLQGTSTVLDASVAVWYGSSDNVYFFKNGEQCIATLSFYGTDLTLDDTITIAGTKNFSGLLIDDFDGNTVVTGWWNTPKDGEGVAFDAAYNQIQTVQGDNCLHIKGEDVTPDAFVGISGHNGNFVSGLSADPDSVYFNAFVNGIANTRLEVRLIEADGDEYSHFENITWSGWRQISVPYSSFSLTTGTGTNGQNPDGMERVKFALRSSPPGNVVEANIDFIIFTEGEAFKQ